MHFNVIGVIVGYVVYALAGMAMYTIAYLLMGEDRAFQPGVFDVSGLWAAVSVPIFFIATALGGVVCGKIARNQRGAVQSLAGLVMVLALMTSLLNYPANNPNAPAERGGPVPALDAMNFAKQPAWLRYTLPFVGVAGVMAGASLVCRCKTTTEAT